MLGSDDVFIGGCCREILGQEFFDAVDRVVGDARQNVTQIGFGIQVVQFCRSDQAVNGGRALTASIRAREPGLRGSDAVVLRWENVHFDRGTNGEIEIVTQKRTKTAIIPLSTELRNALEETAAKRYGGKIPATDAVLYNPKTNKPYVSRARLYERIVSLGERAKVHHATPHCFRDTFACDMLARGADIYYVAMMLADTVETIQKSYAKFVPAARDAAQSKMDSGIGIEERARLAENRKQKVVNPLKHSQKLCQKLARRLISYRK